MPKNQTLKVVKSFDSNIDYGIHIPKAYKKVYSDLDQGRIFSGKEFVLNEIPNYTKSKNANSISAYGWRILRTGKQIGIYKIVMRINHQLQDTISMNLKPYHTG